LYNKIIKNLKFLDNYYSQSIIPNLQYKKYSSIHLRNETDAITFWGKINKMDYTSFLEKINNVYISLIDKYLIPSNEEAIIVLTSEVENNIVLNYLTEKKYNVILLEKVRNLGSLGDKVNVKSGYGRNFLIPDTANRFVQQFHAFRGIALHPLDGPHVGHLR
jgi:hypothetical protein